jgi:hypothetical protein
MLILWIGRDRDMCPTCRRSRIVQSFGTPFVVALIIGFAQRRRSLRREYEGQQWTGLLAAGANSVEAVQILAKHGADLSIEAANGTPRCSGRSDRKTKRLRKN